jgi:hypothetical protein
MSLRGSETTEAISEGLEKEEIATPACRNSYLPDVFIGHFGVQARSLRSLAMTRKGT